MSSMPIGVASDAWEKAMAPRDGALAGMPIGVVSDVWERSADIVKKLIEPCGLHCIKMKHISVRIGGQDILVDVNIHIHCGSLTAVIGRNGAGKTTLVRAILGDIPHEGSIDFRNTQNGKMSKLKIGYVPQTLNIEKRTPLSVYDLIASYQSKAPVFLCKKKKLYQEIAEALRIFAVEDLIDRQVCSLSGGQLQRVLLSMAIMDEPDLLLLDEPVSGIDKNGMDVFYQTIDGLKRDFDLAIILISHDLDYVAHYADQVLLLDKTIRKSGNPREVYESEEFREIFGESMLANASLASQMPAGTKGARK